MELLNSLSWFWRFASAFVTIYALVDATLNSINGFGKLYSSWVDCVVLSTGGPEFPPFIRTIVVLILTLIYLTFEQVGSYWSSSEGTRPRGYVYQTFSSLYVIILSRVREFNIYPTLNSDIVHSGRTPIAEGPNIGADAVLDNRQADVGEVEEEPADMNTGDADVELTGPEANVERLLGREGFLQAMRRIIETAGRYPPIDAFPIHDASSLRPYHRFSDPQLYDEELFHLLRRSYLPSQDRPVGSEAFFEEVDRRMNAMNLRTRANPLPIASLRHPSLTHTHAYMAHRRSLRGMKDVVFQFNEIMEVISPVYNMWHLEFRELIKGLLYIIGRLDQAASNGDITVSVECLVLIDDVVTSLWGLCEMEYTVREEARETGVLVREEAPEAGAL